MANPWEERYIGLHESLIFYARCRYKYTIYMHGMGMCLPKNLLETGRPAVNTICAIALF